MLSTRSKPLASSLSLLLAVSAVLAFAVTPAQSRALAAKCAGSVTGAPVNFTCVDGRWAYVGDIVLQKDLIIDGVDRAVYVQGNVSSLRSADIILRGMGSSINVSACLDLGQKGVISTDWSQGWPTSTMAWTQTLFTQGYGLAPGLVCRTTPKWNLKSPAHEGCTRLETSSDSATVHGVFLKLKTSRAHCHMVIGLAVAGGLLAAGLVGLVLFGLIRRATKSDDGYMAINN